MSAVCACAALFAAAAATTVEFWRVNTTAGKLMLPYLAFLGYANALNYNFWKNNPDVRVNLPAAEACPARGPGRLLSAQAVEQLWHCRPRFA